MVLHTVMLDFSVGASKVKECTGQGPLMTDLEEVLRESLDGLRTVHTGVTTGGCFKVFTSEGETLTTVRLFKDGLVTVNIEYWQPDGEPAQFNLEKAKEMEMTVRERVLGVARSSAFPPIKRCSFNRYFVSSDERLLEYDIDRLVFEERTRFQKVQIVHSKSLGNMLILDDLQNIAEADLIYTETLMARGKENYKDKEIVILGGGDGALLYELLKENPKNVIMLEIDEVVMKACAKHMRSICGDVLDRYEAPNYQIIVGDCMKTLRQFIGEGRKFDYVFGDLTDIPLSSTPTGELWTFILQILELAFKVLKPDGKFMTHGNGTCCEESLTLYENQLAKLRPAVTVEKTANFIPSFLEDWVFYQIGFATMAS